MLVQHPGLWSVGTALTSAWIVMWRTENIAMIKYTINFFVQKYWAYPKKKNKSFKIRVHHGQLPGS